MINLSILNYKVFASDIIDFVKIFKTGSYLMLKILSVTETIFRVFCTLRGRKKIEKKEKY